VASTVRLLNSSLVEGNEDEFPILLLSNDRYAVVSRFEIDVEDANGEEVDAPIPCPGHLSVKWRRLRSETWTTSSLSLPPLRPPLDTIIGILSIPPSAQLHRPFAAVLTVQNRSTSRAADLILQTEASDAFVVAGPRMSRLPTLLPWSSVEVRLNLVPLLCGTRKLPMFKVYDRRQNGPARATATGDGEDTVVMEEVLVVDELSDMRSEDVTDLPLVEASDESGRLVEKLRGITVLVLPG